MRKYREGDWFAIPLRESGFAIGIVARSMPLDGGVNLGYFFGPNHAKIPNASELASLTPTDAILIKRFGDLGLINGCWPLIGRVDAWNRNAWPFPPFGRYEELTDRAFKVIYDDNNPNLVVREILIGKDELRTLPLDRLSGSGAIEIILSRRLT